MAVGHFNFFTLPEIKQALQDVHPDFAWIAGTNAAALCARGGLSPLERALITLASDVVQEVFEGPFQIHIRMVQECGGSMFMIEDALGFLSSIVPLEKTLQAIEILNTTRPALGPSL
jgi:alkylhydroperoxidase/carboxymuconolactone decarboxylase family protein YurZ